jgi:hypothetical protein
VAHDIRPTVSELSEAESVIEVVLEGADRELQDAPAPIHVGLAWATAPSTAEAFGGALSTCHGPRQITVAFTATVDGWSDAVMTATARGVGRAWLQGRLPDTRLAFRWQVVLAEAAGVALADRIAPTVDAPWETQDALAEQWGALADTLGEGLGTGSAVDAHEDLTYPLASLGVQLAAAVSLESLPEMTRSDVVSALDSRFATE